MATGILIESSLSYLGFDVQPNASWGSMLSNAQSYIFPRLVVR